MIQTIDLAGVTRSMRALDWTFQFGQSNEHPSFGEAAHAATWHMAGLIELLRTTQETAVEQFRRVQRGELPERPVGGEETNR